MVTTVYSYIQLPTRTVGINTLNLARLFNAAGYFIVLLYMNGNNFLEEFNLLNINYPQKPAKSQSFFF